VIRLCLANGQVLNEEVQYYQVPEDVRLGPGEKLFDFLAECIHDFMEGRQLKGKNLPLGKQSGCTALVRALTTLSLLFIDL
jgi:hexokinase